MKRYVVTKLYPERLDDIVIENDRTGYRFYGPALQRKGERGYGIEDVTFRNISYRGVRPQMSIISGYNEQRRVKNVRFENLNINGRVISDDMPDKLRWYKTADYADIFVGEHVDAVTFER